MVFWYLFAHNFSTETENLIHAKDHASVQINIGRVDANGHYTGEYDTVAFCGVLRKHGKSDNAMNRYALKKGIMRDV